MVVLEKNQAEKLIKSRTDKFVKLAKDRESYLRIFTNSYDEVKELSNEDGWKSMKKIIMNSLSVSKFERILHMVTLPLPTQSIALDVISQLKKCKTANNKVFSFDSKNETIKNEINDIINNRYDLVDFVGGSFDLTIKDQPSLIMLVDKDSDGNVAVSRLPIEKVFDQSQISEDGYTFDYITFEHSREKVSDGEIIYYGVYCSKYFRMFKSVNGSNPILEVDVEHGSDKCPARFFWSEKSNGGVKSDFRRSTPLSNVVGDLKRFLKDSWMFDYGRAYSTSPILTVPAGECDEPDCVDGLITVYSKTADGSDGEPNIIKCPSCSAPSPYMGAGTVVEELPNVGEDTNNATSVVRFVSPDIKGIELSWEYLKSKEKDIKHSALGWVSQGNDAAKNETQIMGNFETRQQIMMNCKDQLDSNIRWLVDTIIDINYKGNVDYSYIADWGDKFFFQSSVDLLNEFEQGKKIGLPTQELETIYKTKLHTKYQNQPKKLRRELILLELNPFPFFSLEDLKNLKELYGERFDLEQLDLKINFSSRVSEFERNNGSIETYRLEDNLSDVISDIKSKL